MDHGSITVHVCSKSSVGHGFLKSGVGHGLWVSSSDPRPWWTWTPSPSYHGRTYCHRPHRKPPSQATWPSLVLLVFSMDHGFVTVRGCIKFSVSRSSLNSIMGNGLWVSQVRRGFDGFVGLSSPSWLSQFRWHWLGFELVWIVAGRGGFGVEDCGGSACRPRQWRGGD